MRSRSGFVSLLVGLTAVGMFGGGCSSGSSSPMDGGTGGTTGGKPTCNQLVAADVQGLMTNLVLGDDVSVVGTSSDGQQCVFHDTGDEQAVDIIVVPASDPYVGYAISMQGAVNPETVPGVGDEAFRSSGDFDPYAAHGGVMCTVSVADATQIPGVAALVVNGTLDLSDAQDGVIAKALGTVCNRIFGTGNTTPDLSGL